MIVGVFCALMGTVLADDGTTTSSTTTAAPVVRVSIGSGAIGYVLSIAAFILLVSVYGVYYVSRLVRCNMLKDNKIFVPDERMTQRGFVVSRFGTGLKLCTWAFCVWLQTAMLMAVIGHYTDQWPFNLDRPAGSVDWDSFTRVFLSAWVSSICVAVLARVFRGRMESFYLRPSPLSVATYVKFTQVVDSDSMAVQHEEVLRVDPTPARHVDFLLRRYVWVGKEGLFMPGVFFSASGPRGSELEAVHRVGGLSLASVLDRIVAFGRNEVVLTIPNLWRMLGAELLTFFYIYQISVCWLPLYWDYITAGLLLLCIIVASAIIKVVMERRAKLELASLATLHGYVWAKRDSHWTRITSEEIAVGDLVCVSADSVLADCVLISGTALLDESSLSGETMPVSKFFYSRGSGPDLCLSPENVEYRKHYLFAGTAVLQAEGAPAVELPSSVASGALAIVTSIGAATLRGQLIRRLVFGGSVPSPFAAELGVSLSILFGLAMLNFAIINTTYVMSAASILPAIVSIVGLINPLLSVALLGGELRSAKRLKFAGIHTREVHRLTIGGKVNLALLDKTGTITKSGLEFRGVVPANSLRLVECRDRTSQIPSEHSACLAMAHSVARCNGVLVGHQVERRMIEAAARIGWNFETDLRAPVDPFGNVWTVERIFPFSHETMTMSAVVANSLGKRFIVCKGSFEALKPRCVNVSLEISQAAEAYAQEGCFILGIATFELENGAVVDERTETGLDFLGLFLFRNEVKPDSGACIAELLAAGVDCRILTGDSVFTAASVARTVGLISPEARVVIGVVDPRTLLLEWRLADTDSMISEDSLLGDTDAVLCVTGDVYSVLRRAGKLDAFRTRVYARVSPSQKAEIVQMYIDEQDKVVAMCGDGGNDSGALRAAHCGLAINGRAEATLAAPFSTDRESLGAFTLLIRESRAALCTSLASYRFLIVVGIIQTFTKVVLFMQYGGYLSGVASLFIDCVIVPCMLYAISSALPAATLAKSPPEGSLLGPEMILGATWTLVVDFMFLGIAEAVMEGSDWFVPFTTDAPLSDWHTRTTSFEAALMVLFRFWVYIDAGIVYSYGSVHRRSVMRNWRLVVLSIVLFTIVGLLLFVEPPNAFNCAFMVNCSSAENQVATDSWINSILFYYEKIGGTWYGVVDSIEYPTTYRITLAVLFVSMSLVHHIGYKSMILGCVTDWFHRIGWNDGLSCCACCRRRKTIGYTPLDAQATKIDLLNESVLSAAEESPAAEWEMRRTHGQWRAPVENQYN